MLNCTIVLCSTVVLSLLLHGRYKRVLCVKKKLGRDVKKSEGLKSLCQVLYDSQCFIY